MKRAMADCLLIDRSPYELFASQFAITQTNPSRPIRRPKRSAADRPRGRAKRIVDTLRMWVSNMDTARTAMGQEWSFAACLRSNDGMKGVSRSESRMSRVLSLCNTQKESTRREGEKRGVDARTSFFLKDHEKNHLPIHLITKYY